MEIQITKKEREEYGGTIISPSGADLSPKDTDIVEYTRAEKIKLSELTVGEFFAGSNYIVVYGSGSPEENAAELQAKYNQIKNKPRYLGEVGDLTFVSGNEVNFYVGQTLRDYQPQDQSGSGKYYKVVENIVILDGLNGLVEITEEEAKYELVEISEYNRYSIILTPGKYDVGKGFILDVEYIDLIGLTTDDSVEVYNSMWMYEAPNGWSQNSLIPNYPNPPAFDGSYYDSNGDMQALYVGADNLKISNINFKGSSVKQAGIQPNVVFENCKAGGFSFCGMNYTTTNSTYIKCEATHHSFEFGYGCVALGTYIDCVGGNDCFGGGDGGIFNGTAIRCTSSRLSFGASSSITDLNGGQFNGYAEYCTVNGDFAFGGGVNSQFSGKAVNCTVNGSYAFGGGTNSQFSGKASHCVGYDIAFGAGDYCVFDGIATYCKARSGSFGTGEGTTFTGKILYCIGATGFPDNPNVHYSVIVA